MVEIKKCMDTYALVEIAEGNPKFTPYLKANFIITDLTLAEFFGVLLRDKNEELAYYWYEIFEPYSEPVEKTILIEAIKFRYEHKKTDISFFDAVGYVYSVSKGCLFVTGDKEFENFKNVEFMKK